jgi:hypothetical protein
MACFQGPHTIKALEERFKLNLNEDDAIKFAESLGLHFIPLTRYEK